MRIASRLAAIPCLLALMLAPPAQADHDFTDTFQNDPCCDLDPNDGVRREIVLSGATTFFLRNVLADFLSDPILPVANDGDLELRWDNFLLGPGQSLALTHGDDGTYNELGLTMETDVAFTSTDLAEGEPDGGCVVRYLPTPEMFYTGYAAVNDEAGIIKVRLRLEKWITGTFYPLDFGPVESEPFDLDPGENFHVTLIVSAPDLAGVSTLTARLERLSVVGGEIETALLAELTGTDDDIRQGYIGLYAAGATQHTQIAFDNGRCAVAGATPALRSSWGAIKSLYRQ